ncbi:MAG: aldehyde ferredoxin oxidoreductase family protein [Dehalococcoidia bacterium]
MGTHRGKILDVNLSNGTVKTSEVKEDVLRRFIGGIGLAAKLFLDRVPSDVDPLGERNVLFLMTGPLAGTNFPTSSRLVAAFRSPLTNIWGEASAGGNFAAEIKAAGYDGIAIEGASSKPVYLCIEDNKVEIKDASDLWGKDTYEVTDLLKERHGARMDVLSIGLAGENLVKFASIMNGKWGSLSRCGGGAVMGSKKLKAVVIRGTGKVEPALPDEYAKVRQTVGDKLKGSVITQALRDFGTDMGMEQHMLSGVLPAKNYTVGDYSAGAVKIGGTMVTQNYLTKAHACFTCPIACKRTVKVADGPYKMEEGPGPQYETAASFGSMLTNDDLASILKMNETANRIGVDSISCGATIGFGMECFEKGLITSKDLDGGQLRWGNAEDILGIMSKIARREGFGDVLAEGSRRAAERIGKNARDFTVEVKGLEFPMGDPRGAHGLGLAYAMSNRGACHLQHMVLYIESGWTTFADIGLTGPYDAKADEGKAQLTVTSENVAMLTNAATLCHFAMISMLVGDLADALRTTTGLDYDINEVMECGERIWMLKRGLANLMGVTAADDRMPKRILTPQADGGAAGSVPNMDLMKKEYYQLRGLDANGRPLKEKLNGLGLSDLAAKL